MAARRRVREAGAGWHQPRQHRAASGTHFNHKPKTPRTFETARPLLAHLTAVRFLVSLFPGVPADEQAGPGRVRPAGVGHHGGAHHRAAGRHVGAAGAAGQPAVHAGLPRHLPAVPGPDQRAGRAEGLRHAHALLPDGGGHAQAHRHRAVPAAHDRRVRARQAGVHAARRRHQQLAVAARQGARLLQRRRRPPAHQPLVRHDTVCVSLAGGGNLKVKSVGFH